MWRVARPAALAEETFSLCISRVQNNALRRRLNSISPLVTRAVRQFEVAAQASRLHTIPTSDNIGGCVTSDEMSDVYNLRMARKKSPGRPTYDALVAAPVQGRCPLCGHRVVSTLDHHLPKSKFPALAVAPVNLVPACTDCNKVKGEAFPAAAEDQTLNPYFDDIENDLWLCARVVQTEPAAVSFEAIPPALWPPILKARVQNHFKKFGLSTLYSSQAAVELSNIRHYLITLFDEAGANGVRSHLSNMADSCRANRVNSWQTAAYVAMSASAWFYRGGFR